MNLESILLTLLPHLQDANELKTLMNYWWIIVIHYICIAWAMIMKCWQNRDAFGTPYGTAIIAWSTIIIWYHIQYRDCCGTLITPWNHNTQHISHPHGWAVGCLFWVCLGKLRVCPWNCIILNWIMHCNDGPIRTVAQIPQCTSPIIHNTSICNRNVHMCAHFCYKMVHYGTFIWYIMGIARWF